MKTQYEQDRGYPGLRELACLGETDKTQDIMRKVSWELTGKICRERKHHAGGPGK